MPHWCFGCGHVIGMGSRFISSSLFPLSSFHFLTPTTHIHTIISLHISGYRCFHCGARIHLTCQEEVETFCPSRTNMYNPTTTLPPHEKKEEDLEGPLIEKGGGEGLEEGGVVVGEEGRGEERGEGDWSWEGCIVRLKVFFFSFLFFKSSSLFNPTQPNPTQPNPNQTKPKGLSEEEAANVRALETQLEQVASICQQQTTKQDPQQYEVSFYPFFLFPPPSKCHINNNNNTNTTNNNNNKGLYASNASSFTINFRVKSPPSW